MIRKWLFAGSLALVSQAAFSSELGLLEHFQQRLDGDHAAVKPNKTLPQSLTEKACRLLLTKPLRDKQRAQLTQQIGFSIHPSVSYFAGEIENMKLWREQDWQHCSGQPKLTNSDANLAGLAVRAAWSMSDELTKPQLKSLLSIGLKDPASSADSVALIAFLAPKQQRYNYLVKNLVIDQLSLDVSKLAVASIYFRHEQIDTAMNVLNSCSSLECRRLLIDVEREKEKQDAKKAMDLDSYFSGS